MIAVIVFFLILCQVSTQAFLYSELEHLGGSCYPLDSCAAPWREEEDHLWGNRTCECEIHCIRYDTCCADSPHFGKMLEFKRRGEECRKLPAFSDSVVIVSRCSDRWRYGYPIRYKCESVENYVEDPVMAAPVTSLTTNVTYKNYFCALCNYDTRDSLVWIIGLVEVTKGSVRGVTNEFLLQNLEYDKVRKSWGIIQDKSFHAFNLKFRLPPALKKLVKKCYPNMITQCDTFHSYSYESQYKCLSYYSPIKIKINNEYENIYRNIHCAICNGVSVSETDGKDCKLDPKVKRRPFSFALLMDINTSDGDLVGIKQLCEKNEKWDPFFKKCRSLVCGLPGHVVENGKCVPS